MKICQIIVVMLVTVVVTACGSSVATSKPWSDEQKQIAAKEISAQIEQIIAGVSRRDNDLAMKPYWNDPSFRIVNPDGTILNYEGMHKSNTEALKALNSLAFTTVKQDFEFIAPDLVICTWTGTNEFELKDGSRMKIEPYVGSMLFKRIGTEWKIIYAHETAGQPTPVTDLKP